MNLFIHIGFPKTGSTAIQSHVFSNRGWLINRGVYVPESGYGSGAGHQHIVPALGNAKSLREAPVLMNLVEELSSAERNGFQKALITWEGLAGVKIQQIEVLASIFSKHNVILLSYVRENSERFQSGVLQQIERLNSDGSARRILDRGDLSGLLKNAKGYYEILNTWERAFDGQISIKTKVYDLARFVEKNIVLDFIDWLGLATDSEFALQSKSNNPSLDAVSGATLLFAKLAGLDYSSLVDLSRLLLLNIAENGSGPKLFLTPEERELFWQHFLDDNKALFDIYTPENAEAGETGFPRPTGNALAYESTNFVSFLGNVISNRNRLEREVWQGNTLVSKNLAWLTSFPNKGWFTVEDDGVWSKGPVSEISFLLPETSHTAGPVALEITVAGHYAQERKITSVDIGKWRDNLDISRATIRIELDEDIRTSGVLVKFIHGEAAQGHSGSLEVDADQKKRYKLKFLSYKYLWD